MGPRSGSGRGSLLPEPLLFVLRWGQVPQRRVDPFSVVDVVQEPTRENWAGHRRAFVVG
jgi:hypothetical protein